MVFRLPKPRASIWGVLKRCRPNGSGDMAVCAKTFFVGQRSEFDFSKMMILSFWGRGAGQGGSNHMKQLEMGGLWCLPCCLDQTSILKSHFDDIALCGISAGTDRAFFVPDRSLVWEASELWTCRTRQINRLGLGDSRKLWNRSFGPFLGREKPKKPFFGLFWPFVCRF